MEKIIEFYSLQIHNKCKIQTTKVYFHEEGYQYSEEYYYNITCVETDADPFRSNSVEKAEVRN